MTKLRRLKPTMQRRYSAIYRRPGRPRKAKYWSSVYAFGSIGLILLALGIGMKHDTSIKIQDAVASTVAQNQVLTTQVASLSAKESETEKELLVKQLAFSSAIVTSDKVKDISRYYIHKYFPQSQWANAEKVATCESGLSPLAENDKNTDGSIDRGVFQLNSIHAKQFQSEFGVPMEIGAFDADKNVQFAYQMWKEQGFEPWVCAHLLNVN